MSGYILSILGIVIAGVLIDIIMPSGTINKYIKSIYSIFVVAVLLNPLIKFLHKNHNFTVKYKDYEINSNLIDYIYQSKVNSLEINIKKLLEDNGFKQVDIIFDYSIENDELIYKSCTLNLKNMVIDADKQHINKYEYIKDIVKQNTNLKDGEIIINE